MKIYEVTIKPISGFGTPLKGDTIFGHLCWQIAYDEKLLGGTLDALLANYQLKPFAVFSSAYPKFYIDKKYFYAFKTPDLPMDELFNLPDDKKEKIKKRKEYKAKKWMMVEERKGFSSFRELKFLSNKELLEKAKDNISDEMRKQMRRADAKNFISAFSQSHNKINRLTSTTSKEGFAPFTVEHEVFYP